MLPESLRVDVRSLGSILGTVLREQAGESIYQRVEEVRALSKRARAGDADAAVGLSRVLSELPVEEALPVARAFSQFLTLANLAETHHRLREASAPPTERSGPPSCPDAFRQLLEAGVAPDVLHRAVSSLRIELVLTAHPTQVVRRTLLQRYNAISDILRRRDRGEKPAFEEALRREITTIWDTDEVHRSKPSPVEEAKGGLDVLEQVVWSALPVWMRNLDQALIETTGRPLPLDACPISFGSWMGGDRDGNPNVTAKTTLSAHRLGRWMAADLFYREINLLREELPMRSCSAELRERVGDAREPYRALLRRVRDRLRATRERMQSLRDGRTPSDDEYYSLEAQVREPLVLCYRSLVEVGQTVVARGRLLDVIRLLNCFGLTMVKLDLRQDSERHTEALDEITRYLGLPAAARPKVSVKRSCSPS
jgi:phosphoenolpyruvate carboxylase